MADRTNRFDGRTVLVTGASRGIGQAIAVAFAQEGAIVVGTATTREGAETIASAMGEHGHGRTLDVAAIESIDALMADLESNRLLPGILVNNAGIARDNLLIRMKDDEWDEVIAANLTSVYALSKRVLRPMLKSRYGRIVNIGSVIGSMGNAGQANYAASKAGLVGLTKAMAREVGNRGITVNVVAPGFIDTDMTRNLGDEVRETLLAQIAQRRFGTTADVAAAVLFIASDGASYITGETLHVNGGMYMA